MKKTIYIFLAISLLVLAGCEEVVEPDKIKDSKRFIVVTSLISPQSSEILAEVSWSRPVFGIVPDYYENPDIIDNAQVQLSDGTTSVSLIYNEDKRLYTIDASALPIVTGGTYFIEVTVENQTVRGECTVPDLIPIKEMYLSSKNGWEVDITMSWEDNPDQTNYYRVGGYSLAENDRSYSNLYFNSEEFKSDVNRDGMVISAKGEAYLYNQHGETNRVKGVLISSDKNYYDYFKNQNLYSSDDPFSEPVILGSNIEGGLGLFAAYQFYEEIREF